MARAALSATFALLKIVAVGLAVFMTLAMIEEWHTFVSLLRPPAAAERTSGPDEQTRQAVLGTVRSYLALESHCYRSGGDPRFLDRLPAHPDLVDELQRELRYLRHNQRRQEPSLMRFVPLAVNELGSPDHLEVHSREYWIIRTAWLSDGSESDPPRSLVITVRYLVCRQPGGWQLRAWELLDQPPGEAESG